MNSQLAQNQASTDASASWLRSVWAHRLVTLVLSIWTALLILRLLATFIYNSPGHDQNWFLSAAQKMLSGGKLYGPQIMDDNPPLIYWFSAIPVLLSRLLHLAPDRALQLLVFLMICGSVAWSIRILRIAGWARDSVSAYLLLSALVIAENWVSGDAFGQREHLVIILILPFILSAASGAASKLAFSELCAIGATAGLAVCFKPQQVLILVCLEVFLAAWNGSLRRLVSPDFLCAVAAVFAYIELVSLITPVYLESLPVLLDTYSSYEGSTVWTLIRISQSFIFLFLQILLVFILQRRKLRFAATSGAMLACSFAATIAYYIQGAGWGYQSFPQIALLILAALFVLLDMPREVTRFTGGWRVNPGFAVATLIILGILLPLQFRFYRTAERLASANPVFPYLAFAKYSPGTPVFVFSPSVWDAFPAVSHDHLVWASRFSALWMLPAIIENEAAEVGGPPPVKRLPPNVVKQLAGLQRTDTTEDFRRWKPVVVIDKKCPPGVYCHGLDRYNFDPLPWFLKSPAFAAEWSHYRLRETHGIYSVYTRTD